MGPLDRLQVLHPARLLVLFAAHRRVSRDIVSRFRVDMPAVDAERSATNSEMTLGGFGAVVSHLRGVDFIADYDTVLFYGDPSLPDLPTARSGHGTEVLVAEPDRLLSS